MINLAGHALESLANHSGFKKADTLATKQKLVHVIGKGSILLTSFSLKVLF
jgi:deoxyxylulose-5-phosphate synthase